MNRAYIASQSSRRMRLPRIYSKPIYHLLIFYELKIQVLSDAGVGMNLVRLG